MRLLLPRSAFRTPRSARGIFLSLALACLLVSPFAAMAEAPPIQSAAEIDYPPFEYLDENGRPTGYNVELTRAIAMEMGLDVEIRFGPWAEMVKGMEEGQIDVLQGIFYLPERDLRFDFTQPHAVHHYVSFVRKGEGDPPVTLDDLTGKRIVVQRGDAAHDVLQAKGLWGARFRLPKARTRYCGNWRQFLPHGLEATWLLVTCEQINKGGKNGLLFNAILDTPVHLHGKSVMPFRRIRDDHD
ncbi:MAG: transporter substrate-binding domain-containing protein [Deltaproteobacteria bacterium]|nr:transporter substrate-binding domain-containing protein [Deltaproteobacteria bacterium]